MSKQQSIMNFVENINSNLETQKQLFLVSSTKDQMIFSFKKDQYLGNVSYLKQDYIMIFKINETQNDFDISFVFDSYSFGGELLMRELKPNLKDDDNNIFPIGLFVAVSEKLDLNRKFDTEVILKAIDFIKNNKIDYKIAINLSIKTVSTPDFITFLEDLVSKNEDFVKHIVFSITSYSASAYKNIFIDFVAHLNRIGIEILIKRYK